MQWTALSLCTAMTTVTWMSDSRHLHIWQCEMNICYCGDMTFQHPLSTSTCIWQLPVISPFHDKPPATTSRVSSPSATVLRLSITSPGSEIPTLESVEANISNRAWHQPQIVNLFQKKTSVDNWRRFLAGQLLLSTQRHLITQSTDFNENKSATDIIISITLQFIPHGRATSAELRNGLQSACMPARWPTSARANHAQAWGRGP